MQGVQKLDGRRIAVLAADGFEIARSDLRLRGMGDLFGERQSGVPTFKVADPIRDEELSDQAREAAEELLNADPERCAQERSTMQGAG